ncbi:MAG: hypothetical protein LBK27_02075 [Treponema sp.]|jgi:hypothetical protein|nr:hypothetical protein [Treponema sp.]
MKKNRIKTAALRTFFSFLPALLFPLTLSAQDGAGYTYEGKAIVAILPFIGDAGPATSFNQAVFRAVEAMEEYSPRSVSAQTVAAAGVRTPTDMPPIRELVPGTRFALTGGVYPGSFSGEYYLQLWLWDMSNLSMIYTDDLVYENITEGLQSLPGLVEWLFSHIVPVSAEDGPEKTGWKEKRIGLGFRSGVSHRWYTEPEQFAPGAQALNFEGGLFASVYLNSVLSVQAELDFTFDNLVYRGIDDVGGAGEYSPVYVNEKYTAYSLVFPVIVKANFKPGRFRLAPFGGLYAFVPLGEAPYRKNPTGESASFSWSSAAPLGFTLGLEAAMKLGPGLLLADFRGGGDFSARVMEDDKNTAYRRSFVTITLGYAWGFIDMGKGDF